MRKLPPSSAATLPSTFLSFLVHAGVVVAGILVIPLEQPPTQASQMRVIPVELVTVADMTNLTAVSAPTEAKALEEAMKEETSNPAAGAPPPDEDAISFEEIKPKETPKKPEVKPSPAPAAKSFNSELDDILNSVNKSKPKTQSNSANTAPAASTEAPRLSAGDKRRMTASITDMIKSQLITNRCWADHSDMADAKRLRVTLRVWFSRNGKFSQEYKLISPARDPFNDPPLQTFLAHARRALDMCNNIGWQVPEEYFRLPQPQYIDLEFLPKIGAEQ